MLGRSPPPRHYFGFSIVPTPKFSHTILVSDKAEYSWLLQSNNLLPEDTSPGPSAQPLPGALVGSEYELPQQTSFPEITRGVSISQLLLLLSSLTSTLS